MKFFAVCLAAVAIAVVSVDARPNYRIEYGKEDQETNSDLVAPRSFDWIGGKDKEAKEDQQQIIIVVKEDGHKHTHHWPSSAETTANRPRPHTRPIIIHNNQEPSPPILAPIIVHRPHRSRPRPSYQSEEWESEEYNHKKRKNKNKRPSYHYVQSLEGPYSHPHSHWIPASASTPYWPQTWQQAPSWGWGPPLYHSGHHGNCIRDIE